jgi:hypothetical protein
MPLKIDSELEKPVLKPKPEPQVATKVPKGDEDEPARDGAEEDREMNECVVVDYSMLMSYLC